MSKIEGHPDLRRVDSRPGIIINVNTQAYDAHMRNMNHRKAQTQTIQDQSNEIAELREMVLTLAKEVKNGSNN